MSVESLASRQNERVKDVIVDSRINKVLEMRTDTVAMLEALDAISEFYVSNTVEARRSLRQDLEFQNITLSKKFLKEFDEVRSRIEKVESLSTKLETTCASLNARVTEADENMKTFMEKASELENRRNFLKEQGQAIGVFLAKFQLSAEEVDTLYRAPIDNRSGAQAFFDALQRLRSAYSDCKAMVERHCYSAGFELLDVLGQHQDMAYQRLFEWVKSKCEALAESGEAGAEDIDAQLQVAIRFLRRLPVYFSQCQDLVVNSRRSQLVHRFVSALTQGGPAGQVFRAIDLHSHDPPKYVGDMLAWMHQSIAGEGELLEAVFGDASGGGGGGGGGEAKAEGALALEQEQEQAADPELRGLGVPELLARCLQGLGRPLRVRLSQTLESRLGPEVLLHLADLLCFYENTFSVIAPVENAVHSTVRGCLLECRRQLTLALRQQGTSLLANPPSYPLDLAACLATRDCARQVQAILRVYCEALSSLPAEKGGLVAGLGAGGAAGEGAEGSGSAGGAQGMSENHAAPGAPATVASSTATAATSAVAAAATAVEQWRWPGLEPPLTQIDQVLVAILVPLLESCRLGGAALPPADMAVSLLNNLSTLQREFKSSPAPAALIASAWSQRLAAESAATTHSLAAEEAAKVLRRSDLDSLLADLRRVPRGLGPLRNHPGLDAERVGSVCRAFYSSLFSSLTVSSASPQFERLQDPEVRESARRETAELVAAAHAELHAVVSDVASGYDAGALLAHSVEEVRVLLGNS